MTVVARFGAAIGALPLLLLAAWSGLWVVIQLTTAAHVPDASAYDGDPCCPHPDTWGEVAEAGASALGLSALAGMVLAFALGLLLYAGRGRGLHVEQLVLVPAATAVLTAAAIGVGLLCALDDPPRSRADVASRATP